MKRRVILLLITIIFLAACVRSSSLIKKLNQNSYPLWYSYDTVPTNEKKDIKLGLSKIEINTEHFPNTSTVKKHKGTFIPLIAFLYWDYQYSCYLGKEAIRGDVGEFIKTSFLEESKRSGIYSIEENCADCDRYPNRDRTGILLGKKWFVEGDQGDKPEIKDQLQDSENNRYCIFLRGQ